MSAPAVTTSAAPATTAPVLTGGYYSGTTYPISTLAAPAAIPTGATYQTGGPAATHYYGPAYKYGTVAENNPALGGAIIPAAPAIVAAAPTIARTMQRVRQGRDGVILRPRAAQVSYPRATSYQWVGGCSPVDLHSAFYSPYVSPLMGPAAKTYPYQRGF